MRKSPSNNPTVFAKKLFDHIIQKYDPEATESVMVAHSVPDNKPAKNPAAVAFGDLGGSKGGHRQGRYSLASQTKADHQESRECAME